MIAPETDGENIYFYAEDDGTVSICEYAQGKIKTVQENVYVNSPYEHLSKWNDTYATAFKTDDGYEIVTIDEDGNYSEHETVSDVSELQVNEETELLKAEQDSFEWMFRRGETLCTKNGNEIFAISMK